MTFAASCASLAISLTAATLAAGAIAGPLEDATAATERADYATAFRLLRPLAIGGNSVAQYNLGLMYAKGDGVPRDYAEAVKWYRKAADQNNADAQNNLGAMYASGEGVPSDYVEAHKWFDLAVSRIPASEMEEREQTVKNRDVLAARMTPAQIAKAQKLAREWTPTKKRSREVHRAASSSPFARQHSVLWPICSSRHD